MQDARGAPRALQRRQELADFLRTRRARLTPAEVGLPTGFRRNTPGLRRNEVASLAGVSEPWYTWLEQGRDIHPSVQVLESIGRALRLNADEQAYLLTLARREAPARPAEEAVSPLVQRMLAGLLVSPAFVRGRRDDILAWNEAADAVFEFSTVPADERNSLWLIFTSRRFQRLFRDWGNVARRWLSDFRATAAHYAGDTMFAELLERLEAASPEFRAWWQQHDVRLYRPGSTHIFHPRAGRLAVERLVLHSQDNPEHKIQVYTPLPDDDTPGKIERLILARRAEGGIHASSPTGAGATAR